MEPFHLQPPKQPLIPAYTPLRLTATMRAEEEIRVAALKRQAAERLAAAKAEWECTKQALNGNGPAIAVLHYHEPMASGWQMITCEECASYDHEGLSIPHWPCDTYKAIKDAVEGA